MDDIVTVVYGYVATQPRHQVTRGGQALTTFRLASTPRRWDPHIKGYVAVGTTWLNVSCWAALAFNAQTSLAKGQPVVVHGAVRQREREIGDGRTRTELDLHAYTIGHDLRRGRASFEKASRPDGDPGVVGTGAVSR